MRVDLREIKYQSTMFYGPVAQLGERLYGMEKVRGSSPLRSTAYILRSKIRVVPRKNLSSLMDERFFIICYHICNLCIHTYIHIVFLDAVSTLIHGEGQFDYSHEI